MDNEQRRVGTSKANGLVAFSVEQRPTASTPCEVGVMPGTTCKLNISPGHSVNVCCRVRGERLNILIFREKMPGSRDRYGINI